MAEFIIYVLKCTLTLTLLYSLYGLLLRKETFHCINRVVLMCIISLSLLLPLIKFHTDSPNIVSESFSEIESIILENNSLDFESGLNTYSTSPSISSIIIRILVMAYFAGLIISTLIYVYSYLSLVRIIIKSKKMPIDCKGANVRTNEGIISPCSYMHWIMLNSDCKDSNRELIITHELAHVRLFHSLDMHFCELMVRLLWFHPYSWMLRRDLRDVHEYQADQEVLSKGFDIESYQSVLIREAVSVGALSVANSFGNSSIKKRLKMMYCAKTAKKAILKIAYILPLAVIAATSFAKPSVIEDMSLTIVSEDMAAPLLSPMALVEISGEKMVTRDTEEPIENPISSEEETKVLSGASVPAKDEGIEYTDSEYYSKDTLNTYVSEIIERQNTEVPKDTIPVLKSIAAAPYTLNEYHNMKRKIYIEEISGETYLTILMPITRRNEKFDIDKKSICIMDLETNDRYMCRRINGYGEKACFKIENFTGAVVPFTFVFAPMKPTVRNIMISLDSYSGKPAALHEICSRVYDIKDIRKKQIKIIR